MFIREMKDYNITYAISVFLYCPVGQLCSDLVVLVSSTNILLMVFLLQFVGCLMILPYCIVLRHYFFS